MRPIAWMVGGSVASWAAITGATGGRLHPELLLGMLGPLAAVVATWLAVTVTHARHPGRLPGVLMAGFAAKMVFFGVYVAVMLRPLELRAVPFVVSFTSYFIALYGLEALFLRRLTAASRSAGDR